MLSTRECSGSTKCDDPWKADGSSKQLAAGFKVCCAAPSCPSLSARCPTYIRTVDENGCVTSCTCSAAATLPMRTNGPTRGQTEAPTPRTFGSTRAPGVGTPADPAASEGDGQTSTFDKGVWAAIIVVLVILMLAGIALNQRRSNARNGGYNLGNVAVGGIPAHGAPQFKEARRNRYNLDAPETTGTQGTRPQPAIAETDIDAYRSFAMRGNGLQGTREEQAALSAGANGDNEMGGEYLEVMGGLADHGFTRPGPGAGAGTGTGGGGAVAGGGGGAAAGAGDAINFGWQLGGEAGAQAEGKLIPPRLPPADNPALDAWTPGYYHNPDASEA